MKKTLALLAVVGLVAVGCERRDSTMNESAGAEQQIEQQKDAQVDQLEAQKDQLGEEAKAKQKAIEAEAEAKQAQLDAQAEQVKAEAESDKAQLEAQQQTAEAQKDAQEAQQQAAQDQQQAQQEQQQAQQDAQNVQQEAAGAAATSDQELEKTVKTSLLGDQTQTQTTGATQNVTVEVSGGKVTLSGTVKTDQEKQDMETKAKAIQGVKEVENKIEVKAE